MYNSSYIPTVHTERESDWGKSKIISKTEGKCKGRLSLLFCHVILDKGRDNTYN